MFKNITTKKCVILSNYSFLPKCCTNKKHTCSFRGVVWTSFCDSFTSVENYKKTHFFLRAITQPKIIQSKNP